MKDILDIRIEITGVTEVQGADCVVRMLAFTGECEGAFFHGEVMPGGIDLQEIRPDGTGSVSARYILQGTDAEQCACRIYIENRGIIDQSGNMLTTPRIITDSEVLAWLQQEDLHCRFEMRDEEFHVVVCM